jgi:NAD-dependent DNA ligase
MTLSTAQREEIANLVETILYWYLIHNTDIDRIAAALAARHVGQATAQRLTAELADAPTM